ncbi:hypothetical protein [Micromonospora sp. RP3T]|uniref:hypothetical protein n=1 Tax=Micromonospora sp. RP3T TaxID=2135446 RepID=UPI000D16338E|nr:hypothetical protein [Micromonospora sp. RP3T]PTA43298.1 hypothetical protein C8054_26370 [Micromonospora sp. RP3T]
MDGAERREIRRGRRRFFWSMLGVPLLGGVLGVLIARQVNDGNLPSWPQGRTPEWAATAGFVVTALGLLVEVGALVWAARRGRLRSRRQSPLWAMGMRERSRLVKQVRRGDVDADPSTLTMVARQMVDGGWWATLAVGLVVVNLGQALARFASPVALVVFGLVAALFALAGWQVHRDARRAATYLRHHPADLH